MKTIKLALILSIILNIFAVDANAELNISEPIVPDPETKAYIGFSHPIGLAHSFDILVSDSMYNNTAQITGISSGGSYTNAQYGTNGLSHIKPIFQI